MLKALLVHRQLPLLAMALGILLGIPTLWMNWGPSDDLLQRNIILSSPLSEVLTRLYVFLDPSINHRMMEAGFFPWWTYEQARIVFFRPIAALSIWLDYQVWPDSYMMMHLHSLILYGVLCWVAARLYRRLMGNTLQTGMAVILFSLSSAHIGCVVSLAARNLILTTLFGLLAVTFHDLWQRDGWRSGAILALVSLTLSLLSAETGIATVAYLLAYIIFLNEDPWRKRMVVFLPYMIVIGVWWLVYQGTGLGPLGSGFYMSPWQAPLQFGLAIIERAPFLLIGQWILPDPIVYTVLSTGAKVLLWIISVFVLVFISFMLIPLIKRDRIARFWTLGMLLAVFPVCAVSPASGRHLTFISLGVFGLMGQFIIGRLFPLTWAPSSKTWQRAAMGMCILFLGLHVGIYPISGSLVRPMVNTYAVDMLDIGQQPGMERKDFIIVNAPSPGLFIYFPSFRTYAGQPLPGHLRILAPGISSVSLTIIDEHTLIVRPEEGFLLSPDSLALNREAFFPLFHSSYSFLYGDGLFRGTAYPLKVGDQVNLVGVSIQVVSLTEDGHPLEALLRFDLPITDESFVWLMWDWESSRYIPLSLPDIGDTVSVPGPIDR